MWGYWQDWRPIAVRRGSWTPLEPHFLQFRGNIGMLQVLARFPVIFSLIGHKTMAAEAPDHHIGDLDRLEEVRNGLTGADTVGHWEMY